MKLADYLKKQKLSQKQFADLIPCSQGLVSHWIVGRVPVSPTMARDIERATGGKVTRQELRPDIFGKNAA